MGGNVFSKEMEPKTVEGNGQLLVVIIEFSSKQEAIDAYNSVEFQELSKLR